MIHRNAESNVFEFVRVAALRAAQLMRGCTPRVTTSQKMIMTAQLEVALRIDELPRLPEVRVGRAVVVVEYTRKRR